VNDRSQDSLSVLQVGKPHNEVFRFRVVASYGGGIVPDVEVDGEVVVDHVGGHVRSGAGHNGDQGVPEVLLCGLELQGARYDDQFRVTSGRGAINVKLLHWSSLFRGGALLAPRRAASRTPLRRWSTAVGHGCGSIVGLLWPRRAPSRLSGEPRRRTTGGSLQRR
jgi:hypothetical protein